MRVAVAAELTGMSANTVRIWLRKDQALARQWHASIARLRTNEAVRQIKKFLSKHPLATRSEVLQAEVAAVRSLERYAPHKLDRLLPAVQPKYSKQLRFSF